MLIDIKTLKNALYQLPTIYETEKPIRSFIANQGGYSLPTFYLGITYKLRSNPLYKEYAAKKPSFVVDHQSDTLLRILHPINPDNKRSCIIQLSNISIPNNQYENRDISSYDHVHNIFVDLSLCDTDVDTIEDLMRQISINQIDTRKINFDRQSMVIREHKFGTEVSSICVPPTDGCVIEFRQRFTIEDYFKPVYGDSDREYPTISLYASIDEKDKDAVKSKISSKYTPNLLYDKYELSFRILSQSVMYGVLAEENLGTYNNGNAIKPPPHSDNAIALSLYSKFIHRLRKYPINAFNKNTASNESVFSGCVDKCVVLKNDCIEERISKLANRLYVVNTIIGCPDMTTSSEPYIIHEDDLSKLGYFGEYTRCFTTSEIDDTLSGIINESYFDDNANNANRPALYNGSTGWLYHPTIVDHTYLMYRTYGTKLSASTAASCASSTSTGYIQYGYYRTQKEALLITFDKELLDEYQTTEDKELEKFTIFLSRSHQK